jgi:NAD(P)-dependent dehydrogenase (short-subunit alcohol dehydrogenase family)
MSEIGSGTVVITGPTGGLGRSATMAMANRPKGERPDLLLVGRPGQALHEIGDEARATGATVHEIGCDLASLADTRATGAMVKEIIASETVRPLRGPLEIAKPAGPDVPPTWTAAGVAYSNSKLAMLYYAHELQRRVPTGINVAVFEPGFMPGTGLSRQAGAGMQRVGRGMQRLPIPGIASPVKSGPALASVTLDERWAHLRDGDFVIINKEREVMPIANDPARERRLWDATRELLRQGQ